MYGLNAFACIFFAVINGIAVRLCRCSGAVRERAIRILCLSLLTFTIGRYALSPLLGRGIRIPVEFSTVAYFAVPVILLAAMKRAKSWAAYSGLMAGFFYYLTMILCGGPVYNAYPPYDIYISMLCHGALYVCGLVTIGTWECSPKDKYTLWLGIALVAANALVFRSRMEGTERIFIYELLDGMYIRLLPQTLWPAALPVYYATMVILIFLSIRGFFKLNATMYRKLTASQKERAVSIPAL